MVFQETRLGEQEREFFVRLIAEYLKYGSVDKVFKVHNYDLPISYPSFQRLIDRWGIIKAAGPNSILSEALGFLVLLSDRKLPVETLYRHLPPSFKTSLGTVHRILHNIKEGAIRRVGTALVMVSSDSPNMVLIGEDIAPPRLELGKPYGSLSLPMSFSKKDEKPEVSILRVLQHEVFTKDAIEKKTPNVIPQNPAPFMYLDIADVRVAVYQIELPHRLSQNQAFSSFKLINHRYMHLTQLINQSEELNFRAGIREIAVGYQSFLEDKSFAPIFEKSRLNLTIRGLATVPVLEK